MKRPDDLLITLHWYFTMTFLVGILAIVWGCYVFSIPYMCPKCLLYKKGDAICNPHKEVMPGVVLPAGAHLDGR